MIDPASERLYFFVCFLLLQDELCLLSPTFAPKVVYVGKMSVDIPLAFNFARPLKITVADVMVVVKVGTDHISPEVIILAKS